MRTASFRNPGAGDTEFVGAGTGVVPVRGDMRLEA